MHVCSFHSSLWFPCVDMLSEVCTWAIEVTVPADMTVVTCGQLQEQVDCHLIRSTSVLKQQNKNIILTYRFQSLHDFAIISRQSTSQLCSHTLTRLPTIVEQ